MIGRVRGALGVVAAISLQGCCTPRAATEPAPEGALLKTISVEAPSSGKSDGPLGVRYSYPASHPVGVPLSIEIEAWSTDGDAERLEVRVRPLEGARLDGEMASHSEERVPRGEHRKVTFRVVPEKVGPSLVAVDVARVRDGKSASRTVAIPLQGGGTVSPAPESPGRTY
jgi:hypothetical protein